MTQPFRAGHEYRPSIWPSLCFSFRDDHIAASDAGTTFRSAGSAFYNGGLRFRDRQRRRPARLCDRARSGGYAA